MVLESTLNSEVVKALTTKDVLEIERGNDGDFEHTILEAINCGRNGVGDLNNCAGLGLDTKMQHLSVPARKTVLGLGESYRTYPATRFALSNATVCWLTAEISEQSFFSMSYAVCQKAVVVVPRAPVRSKSGFTLALMSRLSAPLAAAVN
jgi:hypothetical protein